MKHVILALVNFSSRNTSFALIVIRLEFKMHLFGIYGMYPSPDKGVKLLHKLFGEIFVLNNIIISQMLPDIKKNRVFFFFFDKVKMN